MKELWRKFVESLDRVFSRKSLVVIIIVLGGVLLLIASGVMK